jgi:hypothetical protein
LVSTTISNQSWIAQAAKAGSPMTGIIADGSDAFQRDA